MKKDFTGTLIEALNKTKVVLRGGSLKRKYEDNRLSLLELFEDHPIVLNQLAMWQTTYGFDTGELSNSEALIWENSNPKEERRLRSEIENFLSDFNFNKVYHYDVAEFLYNSVVCPGRKCLFSKQDVRALEIISTGSDQKVNAHLVTPNATYIQIFDWTTLRDIERIWGDIEKQKGKIDVEKNDELQRHVWLLIQQGLKYKEVAESLNMTHRGRLKGDDLFDANRIGVYYKRYKERLQRLRDF